MTANFPGEYIHMITVELSTLQDGNVIMFVSVDNYSRYCFSKAVVSPLSFENLSSHIDDMIDKLNQPHPDITPTFIMGYGDELQFKLAHRYKERANFWFNDLEANEIAQPVAEDFLKHMARPFNN